jgi:hypothetical protein|tara:strand:- start:228 stop:611 length:384 start_codon:yes stop_codon:yes gene_type:complete
MAKRPTQTDTNVNRLRGLVDEMTGLKDPDDRMLEVLDVLEPTPVRLIEVGKIYLFVYRAKTPGLLFDSNPFIAVTDVFQWGFRGFSAHWREPRQYTWNEVGSEVYEIFRSEVNDVLRLSLMNKRLNN